MKRSHKPKAGKPSRRRTVRPKPLSAAPAQGPELRVPSVSSKPSALLLIIGFLSVMNGILLLPNFRALYAPNFMESHHFLPYGAMIAGFLILWFAFRRSAEPPELREPSRLTASFWFLFFFALTFYARFKHPETPEATFWYDDLVVYNDILSIVDFGKHPFLFPFGQREPGFPYFTAFLWKLMPNLDGVFVDRLSSTLVDMGTVWGLYRLGRAVSGRWLGLFMMALFSVAKPMIIYDFFGYGANTCMLSTAWMAYFFFHLIQKPVFRRFVYLGAAMGLGAFTYVPARPWTPFLIAVTWLWVMWTTREKQALVPSRKTGSPSSTRRASSGAPKEDVVKTRALRVLLYGGMAVWAFLAVYKNGFLPGTLGVVAFLASFPVAAAIAAALLAAYYVVGTRREEDETSRLAFDWATMALLAFLITLPFYLQKGYAGHVVESSALHVDGKMNLGTEALSKLLDGFVSWFFLMFVQARHDPGTYPIMCDSFLDPLPAVALIVGFAFFLGKPSWRKAMVLSLIGVGMVPFVLGSLPNSARILAGIAPLFLMAGWGMEYYVRSFAAAVPWKAARALAALGLFLFWAWNGVKSDWSVWHRWFGRLSNAPFIFQRADQDWKKYRVIIISNPEKFENASLTALCDQRDIYQFSESDPIYLEEGEQGKDVELLFWGYDQVLEAKIKKEFPQAQYSFVPGYHEENPNFMESAIIPFASLEKGKSSMIKVARVPKGYWRRRFYCEQYGWSRGWIWWEDRVKDFNAPVPPPTTHFHSARADGLWDAKQGGTFEIQGSDAGDYIRLWIDGRKVMDHYPSDDGHNTVPRVKLDLAPGIHQVSVATCFENRLAFPQILVTPPNGTSFQLGE